MREQSSQAGGHPDETVLIWLQTEDCVEAHTNVDVVVNIAELRTLLETCLPHVFDGASVDQAALLWPSPD